MVHGVAGGAVDEGRVGDIFAIVDQHGPDLDEGEEGDVCEFMQGEDEREEVVWQALRVAIEWVEGDARVGRWHDPFVVGFVQVLVYERVVQAAMDPVDA